MNDIIHSLNVGMLVDIRINPDNLLLGYIRIKYSFNYLSVWLLILFMYFLPAKCYASAGNRHSNVSVRLSVTRQYCVKTKKASGMISSPSGSPKTLVF